MAMTIEDSRNEVDSAKVDGGLLGFDADAGSSLAVLSVWFRGKYGRKQIALKFLRKSLAGLAFMFSSSILLQILACALYNNWWPMLAALMYVLVPMPCLFFGGGTTQFLTSRDSGGWIGAAKFLTGASSVGSIAIPIILRHAHIISTGAMFIEFVSFIIFVCTVLCFHHASLEDDW